MVRNIIVTVFCQFLINFDVLLIQFDQFSRKIMYYFVENRTIYIENLSKIDQKVTKNRGDITNHRLAGKRYPVSTNTVGGTPWWHPESLWFVIVTVFFHFLINFDVFLIKISSFFKVNWSFFQPNNTQFTLKNDEISSKTRQN